MAPLSATITIFLCGLCLTLGSETTSAQRKSGSCCRQVLQGMATQDTLEDLQATVQEIKAKIGGQRNESVQCSGRLTNVASSANGGTCTASSQFSSDYSCSRSIDGNIGTEWASMHQGVGAWLKISFAGPSRVLLVRIMQRYDALEQFKEIDLKFSEGSVQRFSLTKRTGLTLGDTSGRWWDTFPVDPIVSTSLKIEAVSVYTAVNNGFREVEVWANGL